MVKTLRLEGTECSLEINVDDRHWARCYLITGDNDTVYLGAEGTGYVVSHLLERLADPSSDIIGEFEGEKVKWILSFTDGTSILYAAPGAAGTILLWQDAKAKLIARCQISHEQWFAWQKQLEELAT